MNRPLRNASGANVSAAFGFFRSLFMLFDQRNPGAFAAVFDPKGKTFRHDMYPEYKATRQKTPEDLHAQVPLVEEILRALGVPVLRADGFEADDLIAALAMRSREEGRECWIVSGDKDLLQLVGGGVKALRPDSSFAFNPYGPEEVKAEWGVDPGQILDYLSLIGDASDNVPGVPGVGDKTALKLLTRIPQPRGNILADRRGQAGVAQEKAGGGQGQRLPLPQAHHARCEGADGDRRLGRADCREPRPESCQRSLPPRGDEESRGVRRRSGAFRGWERGATFSRPSRLGRRTGFRGGESGGPPVSQSQARRPARRGARSPPGSLLGRPGGARASAVPRTGRVRDGHRRESPRFLGRPLHRRRRLRLRLRDRRDGRARRRARSASRSPSRPGRPAMRPSPAPMSAISTKRRRAGS